MSESTIECDEQQARASADKWVIRTMLGLYALMLILFLLTAFISWEYRNQYLASHKKTQAMLQDVLRQQREHESKIEHLQSFH